MKTIELTGRLGKEFGPQFQLSVDSPGEAIRALCYQIPGFEAALKEGMYRVTKIYHDAKTAIDENEISLSFGRAIGLRVDPVLSGSKSKGLGKIILGVVLVGAAFFTGGATLGLGATAFTAAGVSVSFGSIALVGGLLAVGGAVSMLTPDITTSAPEEQQESFLIDATGNLAEQGNPVPIAFGEIFTGSVVISTGIATEELPL